MWWRRRSTSRRSRSGISPTRSATAAAPTRWRCSRGSRAAGRAPPLVLGALATHFRRLLRLRGGGSLGGAALRAPEARVPGAPLHGVASGRLPGRDPRDGSRAQGRQPARAAAQPRAPGDRPLCRGPARATPRESRRSPAARGSLAASGSRSWRGARSGGSRASSGSRPCWPPVAAGSRPASAPPARPRRRSASAARASLIAVRMRPRRFRLRARRRSAWRARLTADLWVAT